MYKEGAVQWSSFHIFLYLQKIQLTSYKDTNYQVIILELKNMSHFYVGSEIVYMVELFTKVMDFSVCPTEKKKQGVPGQPFRKGRMELQINMRVDSYWNKLLWRNLLQWANLDSERAQVFFIDS